MNKTGTRRGNHEGSIYKQASGRWRGQVTVGYKSDGRPLRLSYTEDTRERVARRIAAASASYLGGERFTNDENLCVREYAEFWLVHVKRLEVCEKTYDWYSTLLYQHIVPALGEMTLGAVTAQHIQSALNAMSDRQCSVRLIEGVRTALKQIFQAACMNNLVKVNPVLPTKIPRPKASVRAANRKIKVIGREQRAALLEALRAEPVMRPALLTLLQTGMRTGELLALQWRHIDPNRRIITIEQAAVARPEIDREGRVRKPKTEIGEPKTEAAYRQIVIPRSLAEELIVWRDYAEHTLKLKVSEECFVFCNSKTGKMRTYTGFRSSYYHFLDRHGFSHEGMNLHAYRHTCATVLLENGVEPKLIQQQLGHSSITTTLNIYSHVSQELLTTAADALENMI